MRNSDWSSDVCSSDLWPSTPFDCWIICACRHSCPGLTSLTTKTATSMLAPYWKWAGDPVIRMPKCYMKATNGIAPIIICGTTEGRKPRHLAHTFGKASCGTEIRHPASGCRLTPGADEGRGEPSNPQ